MSKPFPALCKDCKWSVPEEGSRSSWSLRCVNPIVNAEDSWALAAGDGRSAGSDPQSERRKTGWFFVKCGMKGKLWEPK